MWKRYLNMFTNMPIHQQFVLHLHLLLLVLPLNLLMATTYLPNAYTYVLGCLRLSSATATKVSFANRAMFTSLALLLLLKQHD